MQNPKLESIRAHISGFPKCPGVYLFKDPTRYRYVGQTRNLRERVAQHSRPSGGRDSATLAFLLAIQNAEDAGVQLRGTRSEIEKNAAFLPHFSEATREVAKWTVQFVEIDDPNIRTLFEVYVHLSLHTVMNTFETH